MHGFRGDFTNAKSVDMTARREIGNLFDDTEKHFEQYNTWAGEISHYLAVDNFGLPFLLVSISSELPDVLQIETLVESGRGRARVGHRLFYCELGGDRLVERFLEIFQRGWSVCSWRQCPDGRGLIRYSRFRPVALGLAAAKPR